MYGVGRVAGVFGEHFGSPSGGGHEHGFHAVLRHCFDQSSSHRGFSSSGITFEQKHGLLRRVEQEVGKGRNQQHLSVVWVVGQRCQHFSSKPHYRLVVAIDAKRRADGKGLTIYKNGGRVDMGIDAVEWAIQVEKLGAGEILLTSMDGDGTKAGYDLELTRAVAEAVKIPVIASGGAGALEHFYEALVDAKAEAVLAASLFHYKELEIRQVKEYLNERGVSVRL